MRFLIIYIIKRRDTRTVHYWTILNERAQNGLISIIGFDDIRKKGRGRRRRKTGK